MPRPPLWRTGARRVYFSSRWTIRGGVRGEVHSYLVHVNHTTPRIYSVFTPDKTTPCGARSAVLQNAHVRRFGGVAAFGPAVTVLTAARAAFAATFAAVFRSICAKALCAKAHEITSEMPIEQGFM